LWIRGGRLRRVVTCLHALPGVTPLKAGFMHDEAAWHCTAAIVDETGGDVEAGQGGFLVIKRPWPSMIRTIWGDPERFQKQLFSRRVAWLLFGR
jgi:acyl-coenzyme A synthetase/AMP-(fatty) acid ligase